MKLLKTHLVPGGVVKIYQERSSGKTAKFSVDILAESQSESNALLKIACHLTEMAEAIRHKANEITDETIKREFINRIRANSSDSQNPDLAERRQQFLREIKPETETEDPYSDTTKHHD